MKKVNKYIINGKYEATSRQFCYYPDHFWVQVVPCDGGVYTELYTGKDNGGGTYRAIQGDHTKEIKRIVDILELEHSTRAIIDYFKKNNCKVDNEY